MTKDSLARRRNERGSKRLRRATVRTWKSLFRVEEERTADHSGLMILKSFQIA